MDRLLAELDRLYGLAVATEGTGGDPRPGDTRAAVLAVRLPAGWDDLSRVWRGVQTDLCLPAPAIALSGVDALQLWFSFASPTAPADAARLLRGLVGRYLGDVEPANILALAEAAALPPAPGLAVGPQRWSAFVSHDLASIFGDTPWLDMPPNDEGQAALLRAHEPMGQDAVDAALQSLGGGSDAAAPAAPLAADSRETARRDADPAAFLAAVMHDASAPLALRIEAARILLLDARRA